MQNYTENTTENDKKEESYGGFQYRHNYDEYKKELAENRQNKRARTVLNVIIIVSLTVLLCLVAVFVADTIMRTKGYTFSEFIKGEIPAASSPHKTELDAAQIDALYAKCTVKVTADGERTGSGTILTDDGYIMTGYDTVSGAAEITVTLSDGTQLSASAAGSDADSGIALVKIKKTGLQCAEIGDSRALEDGQTVYCKEPGKSPVQCRVISAGGEITVSLQGDFKSIGAPVINKYGQTVGVVRSGDGSAVTASHMDAVLKSVKKLIILTPQHDITVNPTPLFIERLGVYIEPVTETQAKIYKIPVGCFVTSAAGSDGLLKGDIIVSVDGKDVYDADSLASALSDTGPTLKVYRNNAYTDITVK